MMSRRVLCLGKDGNRKRYPDDIVHVVHLSTRTIFSADVAGELSTGVADDVKV